MNDELRKAAGTAVDVWDDTGTRHEDVVNAMNDLRKVLAKNANAAPQDQNYVSVPLDFLGAVCGALNRWGRSPKLLEKARNFVQHGMGHHTNAAPHARDAVAWTPETGYVFAPDKNTSNAPAPQPIYMFRRKGLDDFCTCTKSRYDELSRKPHLFETKIAYTDPVAAPQRKWVELTPDEINDCAGAEIYPSTWAMAFAIGIEQTLRRKNT